MPDPEPQEPPFAPAPVEELLRLVVKAARAQQMYLPNNPVYRGAIDALRAGIRADLGSRRTSSRSSWPKARSGGSAHTVAGEAGVGKSADNLAWLFYKDGVREITHEQGIRGD